MRDKGDDSSQSFSLSLSPPLSSSPLRGGVAGDRFFSSFLKYVVSVRIRRSELQLLQRVEEEGTTLLPNNFREGVGNPPTMAPTPLHNVNHNNDC